MEQEAREGKKVSALYQFEVLASPRGKLWYLTRRTAEEDSVACLTHEEWTSAPKKNGQQFLSTVFLSNRARVNKKRRSLSYSLSLGIRVPDYEIENKLWLNKHYEGSYLYRNSIVLELFPPAVKGGKWKVTYGWQDQGLSPANKEIDPKTIRGGKIEISVPFNSTTTPGMRGQLRFVVSAWNPDAVMDDEGNPLEI